MDLKTELSFQKINQRLDVIEDLLMRDQEIENLIMELLRKFILKTAPELLEEKPEEDSGQQTLFKTE